jgi:hypothetical protein
VKVCTKCGIEKDESCFYKRKDCKNGMRATCKDCDLVGKSEYYQENKEAIMMKNAEHYQENKEYIAIQHAEYRQENKETITIKKSESYQKNKQTIAIKRANSYQDNKDTIIAKNTEYKRKRKLTDLAFKFREVFSSSFRAYLKSNGINKNNISTFTILGYTPGEIRAHLSSQFTNPQNLGPKGEIWMNENNQGVYRKEEWNENDCSTWKWQVDHRRPQADFNCTSVNDPQVKECWGLDNLRPYSALQNLLDGGSRIRHTKKKNDDY